VNAFGAKKPRTSRTHAVLLMGYVVTLCAVLAAIVYARKEAISTFTTPEAQQQWNDWRIAAKEHAGQGPVQRRMPKSDEPPSLVLLRDHFTVVIAATVVFTSALYAMIAYLVRGALSKKDNPPSQRPA
jgi:hypothetical protein